MNLRIKINSIVFAILLAFFAGLLILKTMPLFSKNVFFIFGIPAFCLFLVLMLISIKSTMILLLFSRALLDPLLNITKVEIFGENIGVGGILNFLVIIFAFLLFMNNIEEIVKNKLWKRWMIFLAICFVSIIYSPVKGRAVRLFLNLVTYMSIALVPFLFVENKFDKKFWLRIILFSSFLPAGFANFDLLRGGRIHQYGVGMRIQGTFTHPNILAFYLLLIIALVFYFLKNKEFSLTHVRVNLLRLYMLNLFLLLLFTKTRSAWIACWVFFFMYGLLKEKKYVFYCVFITPLFLLHSAILERIKDVFEYRDAYPGRGLSSFTWRLELWKSTIPLLKQRLFFGYGLASFGKFSSGFFYLAQEEGVAAHNTFLELLFETGLFGLIGYTWILWYILGKFFQEFRSKINRMSMEYSIAFSFIVSYLIVCFTDNMLYYLAFNWYFWFFVGILLRSAYLEDKRSGNDNNSLL